jgi:hypothetical protein
MKFDWKVMGTICLIAVIGGEIFYVHRLYDRKDEFLSFCSKQLIEKKYQEKEITPFCKQMEKSFFFNFLPVQEFKPSLLHAAELPVDSQIRFVIFHDPRYLSLYSYCYFVFHKNVDPLKTSPETLAFSSAGFSIPKVELKSYEVWLSSGEGRACVDSVQKSLGFEVTNLSQAMGDRVAIIALNPIGAIRNNKGWKELIHELLRVFVDERAHPIRLSMP